MIQFRDVAVSVPDAPRRTELRVFLVALSVRVRLALANAKAW